MYDFEGDERWRPILGVESIILSVISMLNDPNIDSAANVDASVQWRDNRAEYNKVYINKELTNAIIGGIFGNGCTPEQTVQ